MIVTGPPWCDLLLEGRHNTAPAAQHVAKPHHGKPARLRLGRVGVTNSAARLLMPMMLVGLTALSVEM